MKREYGYYWVKTNYPHGWIIAKWRGERAGWWAGDLIYNEITEINETRILNPDEK